MLFIHLVMSVYVCFFSKPRHLFLARFFGLPLTIPFFVYMLSVSGIVYTFGFCFASEKGERTHFSLSVYYFNRA